MNDDFNIVNVIIVWYDLVKFVNKYVLENIILIEVIDKFKVVY